MIKLVKDTIDKDDIDELIKWLKTYPRLTKGLLTVEFENKFSTIFQRKYSVYVNSGSSANLLMLYALILSGKLKSKKVVVPSLSWATDMSPVLQLGCDPLLCDCNLENLSVDLIHLEKIFKEASPSLFICVPVLGLSPDMKSISDLCDKYNVTLVEDVCESMGSQFNNKLLGTFGEISTYSLYFGHHISTIEGGMVCTDDIELYRILLSIRSHGWGRDWDKEYLNSMEKKHNVNDFDSLYTFYHPGFNLRSTDLQAFIGIRQLYKIDSIIQCRNNIFKKYQQKIKNSYWKVAPIEESFTSSFAYPIIHEKREEIIKELKEKEIETRPLICGSMSMQPFFKDRYGKVSVPNSEKVSKLGFYVPVEPSLKEKDINFVCNIINKYGV
jgi:CDP-4-dehydro-6-deoxyglucose reductase, E1